MYHFLKYSTKQPKCQEKMKFILIRAKKLEKNEKKRYFHEFVSLARFQTSLSFLPLAARAPWHGGPIRPFGPPEGFFK
jgi:hypothetical protein